MFNPRRGDFSRGTSVLAALVFVAVLSAVAYAVHAIVPNDPMAQTAASRVAFLEEGDTGGFSSMPQTSGETETKPKAELSGDAACKAPIELQQDKNASVKFDATQDVLNTCVPGCLYKIGESSGNTVVKAHDRCAPGTRGTPACKATRCEVQLCNESGECEPVAASAASGVLSSTMGVKSEIQIKASPDLQKALEQAKTGSLDAYQQLPPYLQETFRGVQQEQIQTNTAAIQNNLDAIREMGESAPAARERLEADTARLQLENQNLARVSTAIGQGETGLTPAVRQPATTYDSADYEGNQLQSAPNTFMSPQEEPRFQEANESPGTIDQESVYKDALAEKIKREEAKCASHWGCEIADGKKCNAGLVRIVEWGRNCQTISLTETEKTAALSRAIADRKPSDVSPLGEGDTSETRPRPPSAVWYPEVSPLGEGDTSETRPRSSRSLEDQINKNPVQEPSLVTKEDFKPGASWNQAQYDGGFGAPQDFEKIWPDSKRESATPGTTPSQEQDKFREVNEEPQQTVRVTTPDDYARYRSLGYTCRTVENSIESAVFECKAPATLRPSAPKPPRTESPPRVPGGGNPPPGTVTGTVTGTTQPRTPQDPRVPTQPRLQQNQDNNFWQQAMQGFLQGFIQASVSSCGAGAPNYGGYQGGLGYGGYQANAYPVYGGGYPNMQMPVAPNIAGCLGSNVRGNGSQPPAGNGVPQAPGTCAASTVCQNSILYQRDDRCVDRVVQQCQYGCNGNQCATSSLTTCPTPPAKPTTSCAGTWEQEVTSGSAGALCVSGWKCSIIGTIQPTAEISCAPLITDAGMNVSISYTCGNNATSSVGTNFSTRGLLSGTATTTAPTTSSSITYSLACTGEDNQTKTASCTVQVARPSIVMVATPQRVARGESAHIGWVTSGMRSCVVSSPDSTAFTTQNSSNTSTSGTAETPGITTAMNVVLRCETVGGNFRTASTTVSVR